MEGQSASFKRHQKALQTKESILNAAIVLMEKKGFEELTVKNICEEAKVSNGTFFYHFKTKEALMDYYLTEKFAEYRKENQSFLKTHDFIQNIINLYIVYGKYCASTGLSFVSNYYTPKNIALDTREYIACDVNEDSIIGDVYMELNKALEEGYLKDNTDTKTLAGYICTINKGIMFQWCLVQGDMNMEATYEEIFRHFLSSYTTEKYNK